MLGHLERAAINTPIQGGAADIMTLAMLKLRRSRRLKELGYRMLLQARAALSPSSARPQPALSLPSACPQPALILPEMCPIAGWLNRLICFVGLIA